MASPDEPEFRKGVRLGVDWGKARVGVAACDADGLLAYPLETIPARDETAVFRRLAQLVDEYGVIEVVMGLPLALDGGARQAAKDVGEVAQRLATALDVPLRVLDERLTTAAANRQLGSLDARERRKVIDQAAAAGILESALTHEKHMGAPPGNVICGA